MSLKIELNEIANVVLDNNLIIAITDETVKLREDSAINFEDAFRKAKKKYGVE